MRKMICFDMDGTIADLYSVTSWLERIERDDPTVYLDASPMWNMEELKEVLEQLIINGWEIRVISWLAKRSTDSYKELVRIAKREWLARYNFPVQHCHLVQYGTTKAKCVQHITDSAILIDDVANIRNGWSLGRTIDPTNCNLIEELRKLLV